MRWCIIVCPSYRRIVTTCGDEYSRVSRIRHHTNLQRSASSPDISKTSPRALRLSCYTQSLRTFELFHLFNEHHKSMHCLGGFHVRGVVDTRSCTTSLLSSYIAIPFRRAFSNISIVAFELRLTKSLPKNIFYLSYQVLLVAVI